MRDTDSVDGKSGMHFSSNLVQLRNRHRFISFVLKIERAPAMRIVPHAPIECDHSSIGIRSNVTHKRSAIDRLPAEMDEIVC